MSQGHEPTDDAERTALPPDVQEHLGRKLRATLAVEAEKPAFLGDDAVPPRFAGLIRKLEANDRPARTGLEAVRRALGQDDDQAG